MVRQRPQKKLNTVPNHPLQPDNVFADIRDSRLRIAITALLLSCMLPVRAETVLGSFNTEDEARAFLSQLRDSPSEARLVSARENIPLKTLTLGPYRTIKGSNRIVQRLSSHGIDSWVQTLAGGRRFYVHAGAIHDESIYQDRHRKLTSLGFKNIQSTLVNYPIVRFHVVAKEISSDMPTTEYASTNARPTDTARVNTRWQIDYRTLRHQSGPNISYWTNAIIDVEAKLRSKRWEYALGTTVTGYEAIGESNATSKLTPDLLPSFIAYHKQHQVLMAGALLAFEPRQNPLLADIANRHDFAVNPFDPDTPTASKTQLSLAWKLEAGTWQTRLLITPFIYTDHGVDFTQPWHPVNKTRGWIRERQLTDGIEAIVRDGDIDYGNRIQPGRGSVLFTKTLGKTRQVYFLQYGSSSTPYLALSPTLRDLLQQGVASDAALTQVDNSAFNAVYPMTWDVAFSETGSSSDYSIAVSPQKPVSLVDHTPVNVPYIRWSIANIPKKFWLGMQTRYELGGRHYASDQPILERANTVYHRGSLIKNITRYDVSFAIHYHIGLDAMEIYLQPEANYQAAANIHIKLKSYVFYGDNNTTAGFYRFEPRIAVELATSSF